MPLYTKTPKATKTPRPTVPSNKKFTADEFNDLIDNYINVNYQEFLDLKALYDPQKVRSDQDLTITAAGVYTFFGAVDRTFTIDDAIVGWVEIRTISSATLTIAGTINAGHLGEIYEGSPMTLFRWDSVSLEYTF